MTYRGYKKVNIAIAGNYFFHFVQKNNVITALLFNRKNILSEKALCCYAK